VIQLQDGENYIPVWPKDMQDPRRCIALPGLVTTTRWWALVPPRRILVAFAIAEILHPQDLSHNRHVPILVQVIVGGCCSARLCAVLVPGLTLIWGMMNIVNLRPGDFVMLGMYVAFVVWTLLGVGPFLVRRLRHWCSRRLLTSLFRADSAAS